MRKRKLFASLMVLILSAGMAFAGGQQEDSGTPAEASGNELIELEIMVLHPQTINSEDIYIKNVIREKFNIDLKFVTNPYGPHMEKMNLFIASNELPDIISPMPLDKAKDVGPKGALVALDNYFDIMPNFERMVKSDKIAYASSLAADGHLYNFPRIAEPLDFKQVPAIRMDLLDAVGMDAPGSFDELYDVLVAIKAEFPETVGIINPDKMNFLQAYGKYYGVWHNQDVYYDRWDDRWVFAPAHPGFKELLDDFQKLWDAGLVDPEFFGSSVKQWKQRLLDGTGVFTLDWPNRIINTERSYQSLNPDDASYNMEILLPLVSEAVDERIAQMAPAFNTWTAFGVSADSSHIERILKMIDWFYTEEGAAHLQWGEEGVHYVNENDLKKFKEHINAPYNPEGSVKAREQLLIGTPHLMRYERGDSLISPLDPEVMVMHENYKENTRFVIPNNGIMLTFTDEEQDVFETYSGNLKLMVEEFVVSYMTEGLGDAEYQDFMNELYANGADELTKIHNAAYGRFKDLVNKF